MRGSLLAFAALALVSAAAQSNIDPGHSLSSSDFIGTIDWRASPTTGAVINQFYCSGFIYGNSVGWINLGSGDPANGFSYRNDSATDFGVNLSSSGDLSGFAYGANIGWISFAPAGSPKVDWTTGKLSGSAWSANAGWIRLSSETDYLRIQSLAQLPDFDGDGLPDAWEIQVAGSLTVLSANADSDHDGQSDLQEYLASTNPLDPSDFLGPLILTSTQQGHQLEFPTKQDRFYRIEQRGSFGSGSWTPVPIDPVAGTGTKATVQLLANSAHLFFYRVVAYPPLAQPN